MYQTYVYDKISQPSYLKALKDQKGPAKKGNLQAQIEYATACFYGVKKNGKDVFKQDLKLASQYARNLAGAEHSNGLVLYGIMHMTGKGAFKDISKAFDSFYKAIKKDPNNKDAMYLLSHIFFNEDYKEIPSETAVNYLQNSGENDSHTIKQAMGELGILYYKGNSIDQNYALAVRFLVEASESYPPANKALKECTKKLTDNEFSLEYCSRPKHIYKAAMKIKEDNKDQINGVVDQLLKWADKKDYPPAMHDYALYHMNQNRGYCEERMRKAAEKSHLFAINYCAANLAKTREETIKYVKRSIYFKSNVHKAIMGIAYKETCKPNMFNLGVYFRYIKYSNGFSREDKELLEQLKLKAWRDGNNEEKFAYAICLENGFNGLKEDVEAAVNMYKNLSENGYEPATRNFAHFQEFGEYVNQDLHSAIKKLEQYDDIEAKSSIEMMNIMLSDHPELPFPYNHKLNKAKSGHSDDPSKKYTKIAYMLIRNKEMIPNFKLAEKYLSKAKHKSPLGIAINASITGDPRAGKPNASKAEKLFKEALKQSSQPEIKELYADFLHSEERDDEAAKLGVDLNSAITTRPRKSKTPSISDNPAQLTEGKDLYHIGYIKNNDKRYLERAANFGYPLAQSEYAHTIIKEQKKKEYKKALTYLQKSAEEGIMTSYVLLGYMYHKGLEVKSNYNEAIKNYTIAIENLEYQGYAGYALAYCTGNGFDRDYYMANRYITMAKEIITTYEKDYVIDYQMFVNKDYKNKFDDIKNKDVSKLNTNKAANAFTCATYYEFAKHQYQTAFTFYKQAFKLEPSNDKYKRNYAYYLLKGIASNDRFRDIANYYKQLGNADDLINFKIAMHYDEHPLVPYYMSRDAAVILDRIANEMATMKDYNSLGSMIFYGNKVHQQYNLAYTFLHTGAEKYDDPLSYYTLAQMAENGYGGCFSNEEIVELYRRSALFNPEDKLFTPANCKGCYKFGQMLAHGERTYIDLHQACFYLSQALELETNKDAVREEYYNTLENFITNRNVIDPWDEHLADFYSIEKINENEFDDLEITDFSNPYDKWRPYNPSLENSNDPNNLFLLGYQYMKGVGIAKNYDKALEYLAKAVLRNHPQAKVYFAILSKMCKLQNSSELFKFNIFGAKAQGLSLAYIEEAKVELGLYENIPKGSIGKAQELLQLAIDAGDPYALYIRGRYLEDAQALKDAAEKGCAKAYYYIAKMMIEEHQFDAALPIIEQGAAKDHPKSVFIFGYLNMLKENKAVAEEFLSKGVHIAGNSTIAVKYGLLRLKGQVINKNEEEAYKWFDYAHNMNNIDGTLNLAICLRDGIGCRQDKVKASSLFKIGCKLKIPEFYSPASKCYGDMKGIKNWFKKKKFNKKAKKVKTPPPEFPDRIIQPPFKIDATSEYNPKNAYCLAKSSKMVDNAKYKNHLLTASKLGLYGAVKETIYQLISGLYLEENNQEAYTLVNTLIAIGWGTGYKILGDIYFAKEIFYKKEKTFEAYKKASEMGSKSGKFKYGYCIANGIGCEKNPSKGNSIIDSSNCKYAHHYLSKYTKYKIKNAKPNKNCLTVLESAIKVPISFEYRASRRPAPTKQDKNKDAPHLTTEGIRILVEKDIKYGIILFNKYSWDNNNGNQINYNSIKPLETIAKMGSSFGNYQCGYTLYQKGQLEDCIKYLKYAADRGNYYACHFVGRALYNDRIGQYSLAKVYLTKSALELKDADDQYDLAFLSENKEAITWLEMAVENDKKTYCLKVADLFRNGIRNGLNPNSSKACQYYREAIESGLITNSDDYIRVGLYFYKGEGVPTNKDRAYRCFCSASDKGSRDAAKFVCIMYENNEVSGYSFPENDYIKTVNAGGESASHFAWNLAVHYYQIASSTNPYYHNKAADYFEKCGTPEALENARKIRTAVREYEERQREIERQRREAENNNNSNNNSSGGGLLLALGVGVMLVTGLPLV